MIKGGGSFKSTDLDQMTCDVLFYGLGFEQRSTLACSKIKAGRTIALKLPKIDLHHYKQNVDFARTRGHQIIEDVESFIRNDVLKIFERAREPLQIIFDISSINRIIMFAVVSAFARSCRPDDKITVVYCPSAFKEPDRRFPRLEKLGPISAEFSSFASDPAKPLSLMIGLGFEPGIAMGIISQLEPTISYCFWGAGIDRRFDVAVRDANFGFDFAGFATREVRYLLNDPKGSYDLLEAVTYGLSQKHNVIIVPMGPKLFSLMAALIGTKYVGQVAVWRPALDRRDAPDASPSKVCIRASIDVGALHNAFAASPLSPQSWTDPANREWA